MAQIQHYNYGRDEVKAGILHIGVGNFHRAHLEFFTNKLLETDPSQRNWAVCGAMLLPSDQKLYEALKSQGNEYTLTVCGRDGHNEAYLIGSLVELYWAVTEPEKILYTIADKDIRIITLTITEGGYNISRSDGEFMLDEEGIVHDISHPATPKTVFGYVAEGLRQRRAAGAGPITILSCDNLQHNGDTARRAFTTFIGAQDKELLKWVEVNVTFPNTMVDRITPATKPEDIVRLNKENGTDDAAPVYTEDFIQWVVEDKFAAGRPAWEKVGAEFSNEVEKWELTKLSLLNASHTLLSYPSFLAGWRKVDEAVRDSRIEKLLRTFMDTDITPYVPVPTGADLGLYKQTLIERFANRSVSDQVARLCSNGMSKFSVFLIPNLAKMVKDGADLTRVAYLIAAYRHYLKYKVDDNGEPYEINEPGMKDADEAMINSDDPMEFLSLPVFRAVDLKNCPAFVALYTDLVKKIREMGALKTLETLL